MKGDEEETVSRRREEEVCKISVDDTYEGVSVLLSLQCQCINIDIDIDELISVDDTYEGAVEHIAILYFSVVWDDPNINIIVN